MSIDEEIRQDLVEVEHALVVALPKIKPESNLYLPVFQIRQLITALIGKIDDGEAT